jgi:hypothetical protein
MYSSLTTGDVEKREVLAFGVFEALAAGDCEREECSRRGEARSE